MTAAALVSLFSEDQEAIESAAAFALKSVLGLVCDPIAGLVEIPCVKRNVMAAVNAVASAEMALAGIRTVVPFDEVVQAMDHIGRDMSSSLKETSLGGLAATPTAVRIAAEFKRIRP
jgi:L-serine dehydratase